MRTKITSFIKVVFALLIVSIWCSEFLNYSIVGQVKAQDSQFVDPEQVFDQYMETFDREQTVIQKESSKSVTRESIVEDIVIEAEAEESSPAAVLTVP